VIVARRGRGRGFKGITRGSVRTIPSRIRYCNRSRSIKKETKRREREFSQGGERRKEDREGREDLQLMAHSSLQIGKIVSSLSTLNRREPKRRTLLL